MSLRIYKKARIEPLLYDGRYISGNRPNRFALLDHRPAFREAYGIVLQIQADVLKESIAQERTHTARSAQLPDLQIGLKGGYVGATDPL